VISTQKFSQGKHTGLEGVLNYGIGERRVEDNPAHVGQISLMGITINDSTKIKQAVEKLLTNDF